MMNCTLVFMHSFMTVTLGRMNLQTRILCAAKSPGSWRRRLSSLPQHRNRAAESPQESQDPAPGQQQRYLVTPPIRPGHLKSPRRAHSRRPERKPTMSPKNAPAAPEKLSSPRGHGAYRVAMILVLACTVGAVLGFLTYSASYSVPSALLTASVGIVASTSFFSSIIGTPGKRHTSSRNNRGDS